MQDRKMTDKSARLENARLENDGNKKCRGFGHSSSYCRCMTWRDDAETRNKHLDVLYCIWHCSHVRRVVPLWYCSHKRRHAALVLHSKCEHGFKVHRIWACMLYTSNKRDGTEYRQNLSDDSQTLCFAVWCCLFFHWLWTPTQRNLSVVHLPMFFIYLFFMAALFSGPG